VPQYSIAEDANDCALEKPTDNQFICAARSHNRVQGKRTKNKPFSMNTSRQFSTRHTANYAGQALQPTVQKTRSGPTPLNYKKKYS